MNVEAIFKINFCRVRLKIVYSDDRTTRYTTSEATCSVNVNLLHNNPACSLYTALLYIALHTLRFAI